MGIKIQTECDECEKSGNCAIQFVGGHYAIFNDEEKMEIDKLYRIAIPYIAHSDMEFQGFVKNKSGKWVKREVPQSAEEEYKSLYDALTVIMNLSALIEPIFTKAIRRAENRYASVHNDATEGEAAN